MIIAITSTGPTLDHTVEPRFGRCPYFLIINSETMDFEAIQNPNMTLGGGAGPQSAQLMANMGVEVVLTGNCGPNAFQTFGAAGIQVITGVAGTVREAVAQHRENKLTHSGGPSVESHFGMSSRRQGRGLGGGRGMGMGLGSGARLSSGDAGVSNAAQPQSLPAKDNDETSQLKASVKEMRSQIEALQNRIDSLTTPGKS